MFSHSILRLLDNYDDDDCDDYHPAVSDHLIEHSRVRSVSLVTITARRQYTVVTCIRSGN
jgi:hypothetical protein